MKVAAFDVWANYAHFKIPYTTSSRETYPIPPKTTIVGLAASILGFNQNEYLKWFELNNPLVSVLYDKMSFSTIKMGIKLRTLENNKWGSSPTPFFFIRKPYYTVFFTLEKDPKGIVNKLIEYLRKHKSVYHTYLGISNCLANFKAIPNSKVSVKKCRHAKIVHSPIPLSLGSLEKKHSDNISKEYAVYKMPIGFDTERKPKKYQDFILEKTDGKLLFLPNKNKTIYEVDYQGKTAILY